MVLANMITLFDAKLRRVILISCILELDIRPPEGVGVFVTIVAACSKCLNFGAELWDEAPELLERCYGVKSIKAQRGTAQHASVLAPQGL